MLRCIVGTNCLRVVCFLKIKFRMQAGSSGSSAPDRQRSTANYCLSCSSSVYFTYACGDQLSRSLHTPKMGAVVETWHKPQPLILGLHRFPSSIIACFLVRLFLLKRYCHTRLILVQVIVSLETCLLECLVGDISRKIVFVRV